MQKVTQRRADQLERHLREIAHPDEGRGFIAALKASGEVLPDGFLFRVQQKIAEMEKRNG